MRQLKISGRITNSESRSISLYLNEISRVGLITAETEVELVRRIKCGDKLALEKLTKANLRFVVSVAKQYQNKGLTLGDLINEGNLGLIKAAKRFDDTRGFKFITYAVWWIRQSIMQAIGDKSKIIRTPSSRIGSLAKLNKAIAHWEQRFEREPSTDELSHLLNSDTAKIAETLSAGVYHISMDAPVLIGEDRTLLDVLQNNSEETPDAVLNKESMYAEVKRLLAILNKKELEIISLYFGLNGEEPLSLLEIGRKFQMTRERARQIKEDGINKLKRNSKSRLLKAYLR